jgi:hypothetical protein
VKLQRKKVLVLTLKIPPEYILNLIIKMVAQKPVPRSWKIKTITHNGYCISFHAD